MKNIVTNTYSFERMVTKDYVYVDKTALLWRIANESMGNMFFLSRPRRFGKSLMLSTFKAMFQGRRELFKGLAIDAQPFAWTKHPVIHLDLSVVRGATREEMRRSLVQLVVDAAEDNGVTLSPDTDPVRLFRALLRAVSTSGPRAVVLIDEYDAPLSGLLGDRVRFEETRQLLHDFYVVLKAMDDSIRFLMMTGVSKFAKLSVFSGLNNLTDLSAHPDFAALLGYTEDELCTSFAEHLAAFATQRAISVDAIVGELRRWYNGYRFSPQSDVRVLNPVSVGRALADRHLMGYWNATGAATLIIERMRACDRLPCELDGIPAGLSIFESCDPVALPLPELLYQGGYLTIQSAEGDALSLGIPNDEVREALTSGHLRALLGEPDGNPYCLASVQARQALEKGDVAAVLATFRAAFAALPYEWLVRDEGAAKVAFLDFFNTMPHVTVHAERQMANGRIDAVVEHAEAVYLFEFKCGASAEAAFDQIVSRGYAQPYQASGKKIVGIGLNYNPSAGTRGIDEPVVRELMNF